MDLRVGLEDLRGEPVPSDRTHLLELPVEGRAEEIVVVRAGVELAVPFVELEVEGVEIVLLGRPHAANAVERHAVVEVHVAEQQLGAVRHLLAADAEVEAVASEVHQVEVRLVQLNVIPVPLSSSKPKPLSGHSLPNVPKFWNSA